MRVDNEEVSGVAKETKTEAKRQSFFNRKAARCAMVRKGFLFVLRAELLLVDRLLSAFMELNQPLSLDNDMLPTTPKKSLRNLAHPCGLAVTELCGLCPRLGLHCLRCLLCVSSL